MPTGLGAINVGAPINASGGVSRAPLGTGGVTDFATALPAGWVQVGRISEDGLSQNTEVTTEKIKDWAGNTVKVVKTDASETFEFTILESSNAENLRFLFGTNNVTVDGTTGAVTVRNTGEMLPAQEFAFTMREGSDGIGRRIYVPNGQPTVSSEISYVAADVIRYTVTVDALAVEEGYMSETFFSDGTSEVTPAA